VGGEAPDPFAARLRSFGPAGIVSMLVVLAGQVLPPLGALLALAWVAASETPWREIGYIRPASWWIAIAGGLAGGAAFKIVMKAIVMPLFGAPAVNPAYHFLEANTAALPGMLLTMIFVAGFGEETLFRGFLFERLGKLMGRGAGARIAIVTLTSAFFAGLHVAAASSSSYILEYSLGANPMLHDLIEEKVSVADGMIDIPDRPGLGITIREDVLRAHAVRAT